MRIFVILCFFFTSAQLVQASNGGHPFHRKPSRHAFELSEINGRYKLAFAKSFEQSQGSQVPIETCPGELNGSVIIKANSISERRGGQPYYNDSVGFWTDSTPYGLIDNIEYIDQGDDILEYSNGPSDITDWLACRLIPLSPDCDKGNKNNDEYYEKNNIDSEDTYTSRKVLSVATSGAKTINSSYLAKKAVNYTDRPSLVTVETSLESLSISNKGVSYTSVIQNKIVRICNYEKLN